MIYKLKTASFFYRGKDKQRLKKLGFTFDDKMDPDEIGGEPRIVISSLDELHDFIRKHGAIIIEGNTITIYDNYIE